MDDRTLGVLAHHNLIEFCRESARWSGAAGAIEEQDGMVFFATGTTMPVLSNGAFRLDERVPAPELLARADEWFAARQRGYSVWVRGVEADADLSAACEEGGAQPMLDYPEMVCDAPLRDAAVPPDVKLRWVTDPDGVEDFVAVNAAAYTTYGMPDTVLPESITEAGRFLMPHVHSIVAYVDGEPAAAAQTLLSHGIAGVYWVGTVAAARGRGLGEAVTSAVTNRGFELGAPVNTLQASVMGEPIYTRMGYRTLYRYRCFVRATG